MSEWKEVPRAEAITALDAGTHEAERKNLKAEHVSGWVKVQPTTSDWWPIDASYRIRRKQEYRGVQLPLGVKEAPEMDAHIFFLSEYDECGYAHRTWDASERQQRALSRRAIYTDEAVVQEAVRAMGWATE
jgi:hypothetical protein